MKTLKTYLIDAENREAEVVEVEDDLDAFYKLLNCDCFDITKRKIGGKWFQIMCDDIGLWKEGNMPSALTEDMRVGLVGNILVFPSIDSPDLHSLSDEEIEHLRDNTYVYTCSDGYFHPCLLTDNPIGY